MFYKKYGLGGLASRGVRGGGAIGGVSLQFHFTEE